MHACFFISQVFCSPVGLDRLDNCLGSSRLFIYLSGWRMWFYHLLKSKNFWLFIYNVSHNYFSLRDQFCFWLFVIQALYFLLRFLVLIRVKIRLPLRLHIRFWHKFVGGYILLSIFQIFGLNLKILSILFLYVIKLIS